MKRVTEVRADALVNNQNPMVTRGVKVKAALNASLEQLFNIATARILQLIVAVMLISGISPSLANAQTGLPTQNKAVYLGWGGFVDTHVDVSSFLDDDHTLMTWFMPQYIYGYAGTLFANSWTGKYYFGMEDYANSLSGTPMLMLQVGNQKKQYLVPNLTKDQWHHLAVVRESNVFKVYLDGTKLTPVIIINKNTNQYALDTDLQLNSNTYANKAEGNLRFGRKSTDLANNFQTYGLIDDVALFDRALNSAELNYIRAIKRLTGVENGLRFGWCFDEPLQSEPPLPESLDSWSYNSLHAYSVAVSPTRNNTVDRAIYAAPSLLGKASVKVQLPFPKNEVWRVVQGFDDPDTSHNGYAEFSYDFVLANSSSPYTYPFGSTYAPVYSTSTGKVVQYIQNGGLDENGQEANIIRVRTGSDPNEFLSYRHLAQNSLSSEILGGVCNGVDCRFPANQEPEVQPGQFLALVGPQAAHLHFGGVNKLTSFVTIPIGFDDYYASDDQGATWKYVSHGYPKAGQWVKRIH